MSALCARSISLAAASDYFFILVDFRKAKIKRGFRVLRDTAQGSALRTRSLSRKAGESFNMGAVLVLRDKVTFLHQFTLRSNFIRNPYIFPCYNQSIQ